MRIRLPLLVVSSALVLSACGGSGGESDRAVLAPPATNNDGTVATAILPARFDPTSGIVPTPNNLLFSGTDDLTLNLPIDDPSSPAAGPLLALNALDGWSTTSPWTAPFGAPIDADTVLPGQSVRWFEVELAQPAGPVVSVVRELVPGVEYTATVSTTDPRNPSIALVPLAPLDEITSYLAVITDAVTDPQGNNATPDDAYFIAKRTTPLVNAQGQSTDPLIDDATARVLEPLRQLTNAQEAAAASQGIAREDIVVSFVGTTQSITPVTAAAASLAEALGSQLAPTGQTTAAIGGAGIADIFIGVVDLPYYLGAPSAENPTAPLDEFWEAAPGAYVPPFDELGFSPASTNITYLNPFPVEKSVQTVPLLVTVPNDASGQSAPAAGWPVVIFQHGVTRNRTDALALADTMAQAGFAIVAIDQPLHGIAGTTGPEGGPVGPEGDPFYIENTPFGPIASERTFDVDYISNTTGAPGPDGVIDASGAHFINLLNLRAARDNLRQASVDLVTLTATVPFMDFTGDGFPDFDGSQIRFVGQSLGGIVGIPFAAVEPTVQTGVFSVAGGGIVGLLLGSPTFGPQIRAGLAGAGIEPGTPAFDQFVFAAQTVLDPADPINWGSIASLVNQGVLVQEVIGDTVVPNSVPGFPLSGTEPLIRVMDLAPITATTQDPGGIKGATRILNAGHGSLLDPSVSPAATVEMQTEAASMTASNGRLIQVTDPSLLQGE